MPSKTWIQCGLLLVGLGGILACDKTPPPPKTYPVKGKIVFIEGGAPAEGHVEFRSTGADAVVAYGKVGPDGSFSLNTSASNKSLEGTVEGEHTVTYNAGGQGNLLPSVAAEKYKVKADGVNELTIKVAKPKAPS